MVTDLTALNQLCDSPVPTDGEFTATISNTRARTAECPIIMIALGDQRVTPETQNLRESSNLDGYV
jgi:hypothetical protein